MKTQKQISKQLQDLVSWSVKTLGTAIKAEYGTTTYNDIEKMRKKMKSLRGKSPDLVNKLLATELKGLQKYSDKQIHQLCNGFSLMLELINRCETAYRSYRLDRLDVTIPKKRPHGITFVLTAHPTEARSPELLGLFEGIQTLLINALKLDQAQFSDELYHLLLISLKVSLARKAKPTVGDEANNIYSYVLKDEILDKLIYFSKRDVNVSLRSWVGGDKDGHPGVNDKTLLDSLGRSREKIVYYIQRKLKTVIKLTSYIPDQKITTLITKLEMCEYKLKSLRKIKNSDGIRITEFKKSFKELLELYEKVINASSPELVSIEKLMWIFPALVIPLEIREDSEVVAQALGSDVDFAITKMLRVLKDISHGLDAKWYVRGFVLSMVEDTTDVENGYKLTKQVFGRYEIPVVPLFENEKALTTGPEILTKLFARNKSIANTHQKKWGSRYEVMVGYSDSSKENGVFPSRLMISTALRGIEKTLKEHNLTPVFFHGSGGSIERGGGSLKEQTGWWPKSAVNSFKATVQGEMVARNFGNENVLAKQVQVIMQQLGTFKGKRKASSKELKRFSDLIRFEYSKIIQDDEFLSVIELATPYKFLHHLKIGSRPTKRAGGSIKNNLRAIPWILCWTQTRILFPTWWGVGSAWSQLSLDERKQIKTDYQQNPVLISYVKALGFTLAKIELGVWKLYLEQSQIDKKLKSKVYKQFVEELAATKEFFSEITGKKSYLWFRPWLQQSIDLRSSMIHPLNLCQLESLRRKDHDLLRTSVTGIACGMLTTG
jgi:phosphoenolpyruvate carboxylase